MKNPPKRVYVNVWMVHVSKYSEVNRDNNESASDASQSKQVKVPCNRSIFIWWHEIMKNTKEKKNPLSETPGLNCRESTNKPHLTWQQASRRGENVSARVPGHRDNHYVVQRFAKLLYATHPLKKEYMWRFAASILGFTSQASTWLEGRRC